MVRSCDPYANALDHPYINATNNKWRSTGFFIQVISYLCLKTPSLNRVAARKSSNKNASSACILISSV